MKALDRAFIILNCPRCSYGMDVEMMSFLLQRRVFCPCCKSEIQLVDSEASLFGARVAAESALKNLDREFKKLQKTVRFEI